MKMLLGDGSAALVREHRNGEEIQGTELQANFDRVKGCFCFRDSITGGDFQMQKSSQVWG